MLAFVELVLDIRDHCTTMIEAQIGLHISIKEATNTLERLRDKNYLIRSLPSDGDPLYSLSEKGRRFISNPDHYELKRVMRTTMIMR